MSSRIEEMQRDHQAAETNAALAFAALVGSVQEQYKKLIVAAPEHVQEIIRVAKAICRADGYDPESVVMRHQPMYSGPHNRAHFCTAIMGPLIPQWVAYQEQAKAAIAALTGHCGWDLYADGGRHYGECHVCGAEWGAGTDRPKSCKSFSSQPAEASSSA
ncbi:MAG TPA: hypothetical protein VKD45_12460 [Hyphomicrobiaceae bacterium]|nr:hypothetical protein [Hyphomicrobiaceae bacterium]